MSITVKDDKVTIKVTGGIGPQGPAGPAGSGGTGDGAISSINGQTGTITFTSAGGVTASGGTITIGSAVTSVSGRTGTVTLAKGDVGLGSVDNTSDASKPVSTAQANADAVVQAYAIQRANHTGTQAVGTITGLGGAATLSVGTTAGTVAAGDDSRITGALSAATAAATYQPLDSDLTAIAALTTTTFGRSLLTQADASATRTTIGLGSLATQSGTFSGTSSGTNTGDQTITLTGDVTGSGTGSFVATLAASGVTAGTYTSLTVDAKGRVTAGTNPAGYSLPTASSSVLGGIKIGTGLSIDGNGVVTAAGTYTLPAATVSTLGGVIVGPGLTVVGGTVSVSYGTSSSTACVGNDSRLFNARTPTGAAGGDLTGSYPNPTIADGAVVTADLADGAVTLAKTTGIQKVITYGTAEPTGGSDGDLYFQYV